jgi:hypothetical protein
MKESKRSKRTLRSKGRNKSWQSSEKPNELPVSLSNINISRRTSRRRNQRTDDQEI